MSALSDFLMQLEEAIRQHEKEPQGRVYVNVALTGNGIAVRGSRSSGFMMIRSETFISWAEMLLHNGSVGVLLKRKISDMRATLLEPRDATG